MLVESGVYRSLDINIGKDSSQTALLDVWMDMGVQIMTSINNLNFIKGTLARGKITNIKEQWELNVDNCIHF